VKAAWVLRSAIYLAWVVVTVVPWALAVMVASLFLPGRSLYWMCVGWVRLAVGGARVLCGVGYRVSGMEHLPCATERQASVLLAPKHQSTWETFALPAIMPHPLAYVFKRELLYLPFFGWALGRLEMIHIDRSRGAEAWDKVATQGRRIMDRGVWIIMFPEGTRTPRGSQGRYKTGAARLAVATGTPIVPIAISSGRCWPRRSWLLRPGTIDVVIGRPIAAEGRDPESLMREVETWIEDQMRRIDPEAYAGEPAWAPAPAEAGPPAAPPAAS